jgi:hypothetical protein
MSASQDESKVRASIHLSLMQTRGNTVALKAALEALHVYADADVPDDDKDVQKLATLMTMSLAKQKVQEIQLRAFLGLHSKLQVRHLGIEKRSLDQCVAGDSPLEFYDQKVCVPCLMCVQQ